MPRISFSEVAKGGAGFQEGRVLVIEASSTIFQFPPNSSTGVQSDAFPCLLLKAVKLNDSGKAIEDEEGQPETVEIPIRMWNLPEGEKEFKIRPGRLEAKDFDNMEAEPEDLGEEVGVKGNTFKVETGAKFSSAWPFIEESLKKCGFKAEVLGRCITTDFVGLDAHFKQQAGKPYVAKKGANKGKEVTPTNLVIDRIFPPFPYELKKGELEKRLGERAASSSSSAASSSAKESSTASSAAASAGKTNGAASADEIMAAAKVIFSGGAHPQINKGEKSDGLSAEFRKAVPVGKEVTLEIFRKQLVNELLRRKTHPSLNKSIAEFAKKDENLVALMGELVDTSGQFELDDFDKPTLIKFA